jgi:nicotinate-nucleotide adenylyltransferase
LVIMKSGVLGGTFDPIHNGHLAVAEKVRRRLNLDEVIFVPAGRPWLRGDSPLSAAAHRVRMVQLALADKPCCRLSLMEIERVGPSYTIDTINQLKAELGPEVALYFILGWDNLAKLPRWHEPRELVRACSLVAVPRPGYDKPDLEPLEARLPGLAGSLILLDAPRVDVSASLVRERVGRGLSVSELVPGPVADYIREQGLYAAENRVSRA